MADYIHEMTYAPLSEPAWRAHELNRIGGPIYAVLAWAGFQLLFALLLIAGFATEGTGILFLDGVPDLYEWVLWIAMIAGPFLIVPSLLLRVRSTPVLYAAYIGITFALMLGAEVFELNWFSSARYALPGGWHETAVFALAVTIDLIVIRYLFLGRRPNVIYQRRDLA